METLFKDAFMFHLNSKKLIDRRQHGFLAKRSTLTNTLSCLNGWFKAREKGKVIHSVFLDFAKAFDTVSHPKLLHKLRAYGFDGKALQWIQSFLGGRSQRVRVGTSFSEPVSVTSGVPQGTVLGPLLFLLYINDMTQCIRTESHLFADDAKLGTACSKQTTTDAALAQSLDNVHQWATRWQLQLSVPKCTVFVFGRCDNNPVYSIGAQALDVLSDVTDLGVMLSKTAKTSSLSKNYEGSTDRSPCL